MFAALIAVAGMAKIGTPSATVGALEASRLPSSPRLVRMLGGLEVAVGVYAIVFGDVLAGAAVVVMYLGFNAFVVNALVRDLPVASCGCFGKEDTPPSWIHVAITVVGMAAGLLAVVSPPGDPAEILAGGSGALIFLGMTGVAFWFAYMSLTSLPKTLGAARRP